MTDPLARPHSSLSEREAAILEFEKLLWSFSGTKEAEIRERFELSAPRYYQLLNDLIDTPEALAHDPLLVRRLRRLRATRQRQRSVQVL